MQPQTITLAVDILNNGTTTDVVYTREEQYLNRSVYHAEGHTPLMRDMLTIYRTPSKMSGNFPGVQKSSYKFTKDYAIAGVDQATLLIAPMIKENANSVPLGILDADLLIMRQRDVAMQDRDDILGPLMSKLSI